MSNLISRIAVIALSTFGLTVALILGHGAWHPIDAGLPDAGRAITWSLNITSLCATLLGARILGGLFVLCMIEPQSDRTVTREGRDRLLHLGRLSLIWSGLLFVISVLTLSVVLGLSAADTMRPGVIGTYLWSLPPSRSFVIASVMALVVCAVGLFVVSLNSVALIAALATAAIIAPLLNSHSASLGDHSLALTSSVIHGVSMSLWVGGLWAVVPYIRSRSVDVVKRYSTLATWSVSALIVSGVAASYARLDAVSDLWRSGYGQLVSIKVVLFVVIAVLATRVRAALAAQGNVMRFVGAEVGVMALAIGVGVALHATPLSRLATQLPSAAEEILGFRFPPAPSAMRMLFGWHPEWFMLSISLVALCLYYMGLRRLKASSISWPVLRTVSFTCGLVLVMWASSAGIAKYAMVSFASHMIQHMILSMIAPIFVVLGAPITLALRALPAQREAEHRNAREWLLAILHSTYSRFITQPIIVLIIFTFGLYGMYFTSLFANLMSGHVGHVFMEVHFLISGLLFSFIVIGVDPAPRHVPHWTRLMLVMVAISLHAFFAIALMQSTVPVGNAWYSIVRPPWIDNPLTDTYNGGGIAWGLGEVPSLILMVVVAVQWAMSDTKLAKRLDRQADRDGDAELRAYNQRLTALNQRDS